MVGVTVKPIGLQLLWNPNTFFFTINKGPYVALCVDPGLYVSILCAAGRYLLHEHLNTNGQVELLRKNYSDGCSTQS